MTTTLFDQLKKMIDSEVEFSKIFDFFLKNFGDHQEFYEMGKLSNNAEIFRVLKSTGKRIFGNKTISNPRLTEISKQKFIHGTCFLDGNLTLVIFFSDLQKGLASISRGGAMFNYISLKIDNQPSKLRLDLSQDSESLVTS